MNLDFLNDKRLQFEDAGMLTHILDNIEGDPSAQWLKTRTPGGRDKIARILKVLTAAGYICVHRSPRQPNVYGVRGCLADNFRRWGPGELPGQIAPATMEVKSDSSAMTEISAVCEGEMVEVEVEVEVLHPQPRKTGRPAGQSKAFEEKAKEREDFNLLVKAYKEMLKQKKKPNNFGQKNAAAREFGKLAPEIDKDPELFAKIIESLKGYSIISQGYPLALARYISNRIWEDIEEDLKTLDQDEEIDWGDGDDKIVR